jgi:chromate transporter
VARQDRQEASERIPASPTEVFGAVVRLGLTSFGGPVAHLGYFREEFVQRRRWVSEEQYAQLLTMAQLLPGPASSQLGFALGMLRAGWRGACAAFLGFTLPSALLMTGFAYLMPSLSGRLAIAALHGLKLVAVCVVARIENRES